MSEYYHEFEVGFNWWMVTAPLFAVAMIALGMSLYHMKERDGRLIIYRNLNDNILYVAGIVFAVVIGVQLIVESGNGIIQYFDNGLGRYESPVWSVVGLAMAVPCVVLLYGVLIIGLGKVGTWIKRGILEEERTRIRRGEKNKSSR